MNSSIADEKNELRQFGFPERILSILYDLIDVSNYNEHHKARKSLVKESENILPVMHKLANSNYKTTRKEAIKIVQIIGHKSSIPVLINMLEDDETEIRWIAAEGLIKIGRDSIEPLLKQLIANSKSYYLRRSAHHVLMKLINKKDSEDLKQLLHNLRSGNEILEKIPIDAEHIINKGIL